jgi:hypothetical protein
MKKLLVPIMVLGLAAFSGAAFAQAAISPRLNGNSTPDNVSLAASSDITIAIQSEDGLVYIVYLELTDVGCQRAAPALGDIIGMLPNTMTVASLGLAGFFYRRRRRA